MPNEDSQSLTLQLQITAKSFMRQFNDANSSNVVESMGGRWVGSPKENCIQDITTSWKTDLQLHVKSQYSHLISSHFSGPNRLLISFSKAELTNPYCVGVNVQWNMNNKNCKTPISRGKTGRANSQALLSPRGHSSRLCFHPPTHNSHL